eukprot:CAMPEP_0113826628 /NCGR_PEP_ID=MMETSP0328-20130328/4356_1 /TAXON_ID=39455 /ORGANISM="Alexandrium minutum" /LENGTH=330 /DNA_ID=CAMNT_0000794605 /DNA_START=167 /DNA_END=1156 /DNA_ORIENTATION=+ /assembly_acc=CAM_ASM_000350
MDRVSNHNLQHTLGLQALPPPPPASGLHIRGVDIDVTEQDGVTFNIDIPISVRNNMEDSFHGNNGATSKTGDVERLNGAYKDNDIPASHGTVRLKGIPVEGDNGGDGGRALKAQNLALPGGEAVSAGRQAGPRPRSLMSPPKPGSVSSWNEVVAVQTSADDALEKPALKHMLKSEEKSLDGKMLDTVMDHLMPVLNRQLEPNLKGNLKLDVAKSFTVSDGKSKTVNVGVTANNATQVASYDKLLELLLGGQASKTGPVVIDDMHIRIKKQQGFQFNFAPIIDVSNDIAGSFTDNNKASSGAGNVIRANGAFNQNEFVGTSKEPLPLLSTV